ncbi:tail fiber assembly protein [Salmonella enterica subsp. enterica serovar Poona]|uniref:tail fiber assembly protein n=1 Tax=Enterobacter asburiae TaxID=61645 RepID=UPI0012C7DE5D|nr:tail fiber assembly protein [Enterobacter asburiae]EBS2937772.1 tail fiber assembly protein [Salmonella enterica subsp. enterica serovar Poona]EBV3684916.1 tail fiber assembly protein [Salmonella enterica subsp. enterica serovar Poona]EBZ8624386.1 tail fiber assembly protein [Salmonella enterica subsp. enterica serovar Poona]ECA5941056.1 tail fiber assembly protein [Salmonella enterica subsp. enterica serovar Poona]ECD4809183.1 tail fiber assembly protein [Salmonella enterica subsp. enteric
MAKAELNQDMIATVAGEITVYNYDGETREYLSSSVEYLAVGVGIPANSCVDAPGEKKEGFAICRTADLSSWEYITDHRGQTVYSTETRQQIEVTALGSYPEGTTPNAPASPYDKWDGEKWVTDSAAKHEGDIADAEQHRQTLLEQVDELTSDWRVELMLGDISEENKKRLSSWMAYKTAVKAVDVSTAPNVSWPAQPEA